MVCSEPKLCIYKVYFFVLEEGEPPLQIGDFTTFSSRIVFSLYKAPFIFPWTQDSFCLCLKINILTSSVAENKVWTELVTVSSHPSSSDTLMLQSTSIFLPLVLWVSVIYEGFHWFRSSINALFIHKGNYWWYSSATCPGWCCQLLTSSASPSHLLLPLLYNTAWLHNKRNWQKLCIIAWFNI